MRQKYLMINFKTKKVTSICTYKDRTTKRLQKLESEGYVIVATMPLFSRIFPFETFKR